MSARDRDPAIERACQAARANAFALLRFRDLPLEARRQLAQAACRAHPDNAQHRRRWIKARLWLDTYCIPPYRAIGKGVGQERPITELERWEKAARAVC